MSNPAVYVLGETQIKNTRIRIEDNLGEAIHIHIGEFRISLSVVEFYDIVNQLQMAADKLLRLRGLSINLFDFKAFDWNWLHRYEHIVKIEKIYLKIGDLLTKGEAHVGSGINIIVPVSESRQYKALKGNNSELERYEEKNLLGQTNRERLDSVMEYINKCGYPYDGKYIMVNQYNQIYDGDHRAACLLCLKGNEEVIPVIQITFDDEPTIEEQLENQKKLLNNYLEKMKNQHQPVYQWSEDLNVLNYTFEEFKTEMEKGGIDYYCIDHSWSGENGEIIANKIVVIQQNSMIDFCHKMKVSYYGKNVYRRFSFLYSMQRAVYIELSDVKIIVLDRLACKSKFENAIIPLDKRIQSYANKNVVNHVVNKKIEFIYVIVDSMLNGCGYKAKSREYIQKNKEYLMDEEVKNMLGVIFFSYYEKLIECLNNRDYKGAYVNYITNTDY